MVPLIDGLTGALIPPLTWFGAIASLFGVGFLESSGSPPCVCSQVTLLLFFFSFCRSFTFFMCLSLCLSRLVGSWSKQKLQQTWTVRCLTGFIAPTEYVKLDIATNCLVPWLEPSKIAKACFVHDSNVQTFIAKKVNKEKTTVFSSKFDYCMCSICYWVPTMLQVGDVLNLLSALFFGIHMLRTEQISRRTSKKNFLPILSFEVIWYCINTFSVWSFHDALGIEQSNKPIKFTKSETHDHGASSHYSQVGLIYIIQPFF